MNLNTDIQLRKQFKLFAVVKIYKMVPLHVSNVATVLRQGQNCVFRSKLHGKEKVSNRFNFLPMFNKLLQTNNMIRPVVLCVPLTQLKLLC